MRVLVVENEETVGEVFRAFLNKLGHEPVVVGSAEAAVPMLDVAPPDAILLDVMLPGMSGIEFLGLPTVRDREIPVVVMSGVATEVEARQCLEFGAFEFIGKPVGLPRLEALLARLDGRTRDTVGSGEQAGVPHARVAIPVRMRPRDGVELAGASLDVGTAITLQTGAAPGPVISELMDAERAPLEELVAGGGSHASTSTPHLRILHTIAQAVSRSLDVEEVLRIALDALTKVTGHEISSLHLVSDDGMTLHLRGDRGLRPQLRDVNRVLPVGQGIIGRVAETGRTFHHSNVPDSPELLPEASATVAREGIRGLVCVPIRNHGRTLGVLSLGRRLPAPFTDGEIELVEASANQIGVALENARLYAETKRQVESLKHVEGQLLEGERLSTIGKLAAGVAHEINNPLTAILGHAELLLIQAGPTGPTRAGLRAIVEETSRAARLLRSMLQLSRRRAPERRPCALEEQVKLVLDLKRHELRRDQIEVVTSFDPVPAVSADVDQIRQVLLNLVQNAHQALAAARPPRVLNVGVADAGDYAQLVVADNGPGIPSDVLPRIFDAFFTTKSAGEGTGLGLWVSYSIVEQHDGRLSARNRPEGGASFVVELPYAAAGSATT